MTKLEQLPTLFHSPAGNDQIKQKWLTTLSIEGSEEEFDSAFETAKTWASVYWVTTALLALTFFGSFLAIGVPIGLGIGATLSLPWVIGIVAAGLIATLLIHYIAAKILDCGIEKNFASLQSFDKGSHNQE